MANSAGQGRLSCLKKPFQSSMQLRGLVRSVCLRHSALTEQDADAAPALLTMAGAWAVLQRPGRDFCLMQTPAVGHSLDASHCQCVILSVLEMPKYTALLASDAACRAQAPHSCRLCSAQKEQTRSCKQPSKPWQMQRQRWASALMPATARLGLSVSGSMG